MYKMELSFQRSLFLYSNKSSYNSKSIDTVLSLLIYEIIRLIFEICMQLLRAVCAFKLLLKS